MKKYILEERVIKPTGGNKPSFGAGSKAVQDINQILKRNGYEPACILRYSERSSTIAKVLNQLFTLYSWVRLVFKVKKGDLFVIQCPLHRHQTGRGWAQKRIRKKAHVVSVLHDIEELRRIFVLTKNDIREFEITLQSSEYLIAHNYAMKQYLIGRGFPADRIVELDLFDYLADEPLPEKQLSKNGAIAIAGNCSREKSAYMYQLDSLQWEFELYGLNFEKDSETESVHYNGAVEAGKLPNVLSGSYGLVWDGPEVRTCAGATGEYMRYNNPHKTSLYAAAGLPVIIWKEAAMARFVQKKNIGIVVSSLQEISEILSSKTEEEYQKMRRNILKVSAQVRKGYYILKALDAVCNGGCSM